MRGDRGQTHPLYGADLGTLWQVWRQANGRYLENGQKRLFHAFLAAAARLPFTLAESLYVAAAGAGSAQPEAPVFILGHWRSGTTHLYNVLSKAPHFAYVSPFATALPRDFLLLARVLKPLLAKQLPDHRYIDRVAVDPDSPQEDEIALANMSSLSYYHALYFPAAFDRYFDAGIFFDGCSDKQLAQWKLLVNRFYNKLCMQQPGRRLLIKNPVYTARIRFLLDIWPDARFIHIHRNPYKVFVSMRNFYTRLFEQFALQDWHAVDIDEVIYRTYDRMMVRYSEQAADLPADRLVELSFGDFQRDPLYHLRLIYTQLGLEGFNAAESGFKSYLASVSNYRKADYQYDNKLVEKIGRRWEPFISRWDYSVPT